LYTLAQQGQPLPAPRAPLVLLTAAEFWEIRRREGWVYCRNPSKQHLVISRLAEVARTLAAEHHRSAAIDGSTRPAHYPLDLLELAWERLRAAQAVQLWKDLDEATALACIPPRPHYDA
jgi:hypothetical protein